MPTPRRSTPKKSSAASKSSAGSRVRAAGSKVKAKTSINFSRSVRGK